MSSKQEKDLLLESDQWYQSYHFDFSSCFLMMHIGHLAKVTSCFKKLQALGAMNSSLAEQWMELVKLLLS